MHVRNSSYLRSRYLLAKRKHAAATRRLSTEVLNHDADINAFVGQSNACQFKNALPARSSGSLRVAIKDNICTREFKTSCSSAMLENFTSPYDATVVQLLREAGHHIVGKTNCDEFGMGSHNIHSIHGPVSNPFKPSDRTAQTRQERRSAGGSSGGSAAAVAAGLCDVALSTDTGGSTRLPAAYCGIAGLKPSYGLISRWGIVSYADSLDCVGIMASNSYDIQPIFKLLSRHDPKDPTSANEELRRKISNVYPSGEPASIKDLVIGVPQEYFPSELDRTTLGPFNRIIKKLMSAGAKVVPVSLPSTRYALSAYYVIASAEASSNLAKYSGIHYGLRVEPPPEADRKKVSNVYAYSRSKGFGHEVQKRILLGTYALTADAFDNYFLQAQRIRNLIKNDFDRVFRKPNPLRKGKTPMGGVDVLLHPSAVGTAPLIEDTYKMSKLEAYVQDVLTVPASLAGLPALSVPAGVGQDNWPLGVSIVGQWGSDECVIDIGSKIMNII